MIGARDDTPDRSRRHVPVHRHRGIDAVGTRPRVERVGGAGRPSRRRCCGAAIEGHRGAVVKTEGDAFFAAFADSLSAVTAAVAAQRAIAAEAWDGGLVVRVRMGLHLGEGRLRAVRNPGERRGLRRDRRELRGPHRGRRQRRAGRRSSTRWSPPCPAISAVTGLAGVAPRRRRPARGQGLRRAAARSTGSSSRAPPRTPGRSARPRRPRICPATSPSFVGREDERAAVRDELRASRIVTLTGPGGSGKTRLALAVARDVRDAFPHGTWFVDLAAIRDPALIEPTIAAAMGVRESPEQPVEDALRAHLRDRTPCSSSTTSSSCCPTAPRSWPGSTRDAPRCG